MSDCPQWVFHERVKGLWWEIGDVSNPIKVSHIAGFYDFRFAIPLAWKTDPISILDLPGTKIGSGELSVRENTMQPENGINVTSGPFMGFGSDDMADPQMRKECRRDVIRLQKLIEEAEAEGKHKEAEKYEDDIKKIENWMLDCLLPGGGRKKLDDGDPLKKPCGRARSRKKRAVDRLVDLGLKDIAEHFRLSYCIQNGAFTYCPDPNPDWKTQSECV